MRWVKLTFPPRARRRWLLITTRLSKSSLAGTARTLVAVGTCRDDSMFATTRAAAPRSGADVAVSAEAGAGDCLVSPLLVSPLLSPLLVSAVLASGVLVSPVLVSAVLLSLPLASAAARPAAGAWVGVSAPPV